MDGILLLLAGLAGNAIAQAPPAPPAPPAGSPTAGSPPPPPPAGRRGILVQLYDPDGRLTQPPVVLLTGSDGTRLEARPLDDGTMPDIQAGDGTWSAPVFGAPTGALAVEITAGAASWTGEVTIDPADDRPRIFLRLDEGVARPANPDEVGGPDPGATAPAEGTRPPPPEGEADSEGEADATPPPPPATGSPEGLSARRKEGAAVDLRPGAALEIVGWLLACLGAGLGLALLGRRSRGPARLATPLQGEHTAWRIGPEGLIGVLEGPLRGHRVVVLGAAPERPEVVQVEEDGPLPAELVAAVEALAAVAGPPVALLVTELDRLDRQGPGSPAHGLARCVAGRFPLVVVGGPSDWPEPPAP